MRVQLLAAITALAVTTTAASAYTRAIITSITLERRM
jgi:hypothetical protein